MEKSDFFHVFLKWSALAMGEKTPLCSLFLTKITLDSVSYIPSLSQ